QSSDCRAVGPDAHSISFLTSNFGPSLSLATRRPGEHRGKCLVVDLAMRSGLLGVPSVARSFNGRTIFYRTRSTVKYPRSACGSRRGSLPQCRVRREAWNDSRQRAADANRCRTRTTSRAGCPRPYGTGVGSFFTLDWSSVTFSPTFSPSWDVVSLTLF